MGKNKPTPKKLCIAPIDLAKHKISKLDFKPARFNQFTISGEEKSIVTATGDYLVTFSFKHVKKGILNKYRIQKMLNPVIDSQFQVNNDEKIIVTDDQDAHFKYRAKKEVIQY